MLCFENAIFWYSSFTGQQTTAYNYFFLALTYENSWRLIYEEWIFHVNSDYLNIGQFHFSLRYNRDKIPKLQLVWEYSPHKFTTKKKKQKYEYLNQCTKIKEIFKVLSFKLFATNFTKYIFFFLIASRNVFIVRWYFFSFSVNTFLDRRIGPTFEIGN